MAMVRAANAAARMAMVRAAIAAARMVMVRADTAAARMVMVREDTAAARAVMVREDTVAARAVTVRVVTVREAIAAVRMAAGMVPAVLPHREAMRISADWDCRSPEARIIPRRPGLREAIATTRRTAMSCADRMARLYPTRIFSVLQSR